MGSAMDLKETFNFMETYYRIILVEQNERAFTLSTVVTLFKKPHFLHRK